MPPTDTKQLHLKVPKHLHALLKSKAKALNFTVQEYSELALARIVSDRDDIMYGRPDPVVVMPPPRFTFIDLFAGIGGMRLAFQQHGGSCVFSSEWDRWCQKTYFANFGELPHGDITAIEPISIPDHDILTAGFPCQPFSIAGVSKKNSLGRAHGFEDKTQGTLFFNVASIIAAKRPKMFLLENVKNLRGHDKGNTFRVIMETLNELGYTIFHKIIDAQPYVPQHRERIFIVGFDREVFGDLIPFEFPDPPSTSPKLKKVFEKNVDPKYILSDHLWGYLQGYAEKHREKGNGFGFGLFDGNGVARTLSARYYKDGSEILISVPDCNPRRLTPRECARLMGYPDSYRITVSDTQAYKQFGNSVVVPVVTAIGDAMLKTYHLFQEDRQSGWTYSPKKRAIK